MSGRLVWLRWLDSIQIPEIDAMQLEPRINRGSLRITGLSRISSQL